MMSVLQKMQGVVACGFAALLTCGDESAVTALSLGVNVNPLKLKNVGSSDDMCVAIWSQCGGTNPSGEDLNCKDATGADILCTCCDPTYVCVGSGYYYQCKQDTETPVCTCGGGKAATGSACTDMGKEICTSCNDGWTLTDSQCVVEKGPLEDSVMTSYWDCNIQAKDSLRQASWGTGANSASKTTPHKYAPMAPTNAKHGESVWMLGAANHYLHEYLTGEPCTGNNTCDNGAYGKCVLASVEDSTAAPALIMIWNDCPSGDCADESDNNIAHLDWLVPGSDWYGPSTANQCGSTSFEYSSTEPFVTGFNLNGCSYTANGTTDSGNCSFNNPDEGTFSNISTLTTSGSKISCKLGDSDNMNSETVTSALVDGCTQYATSASNMGLKTTLNSDKSYSVYVTYTPVSCPSEYVDFILPLFDKNGPTYQTN